MLTVSVDEPVKEATHDLALRYFPGASEKCHAVTITIGEFYPLHTRLLSLDLLCK
jgi:hypothetical protein